MRLNKGPRLLLLVGLLGLAGVSVFAFQGLPSEAWRETLADNDATRKFSQWLEPPITRVAVTSPVAKKIVEAAHSQKGDAYNASYRKMAYPGGDVPRGGGACTDVVVRALRGAGYDLQKLIHEDMKRDFKRYPDPWGLGRTDSNIDHRRVPNQMAFFEKYGHSLPLGTTGNALASWKPGDIISWKLEGGKWHTGIVSDGVGARGKPLVIHNAWMCIEQDYLDHWEIVGHYRFPK
jgi:hypothetical protein